MGAESRLGRHHSARFGARIFGLAKVTSFALYSPEVVVDTVHMPGILVCSVSSDLKKWVIAAYEADVGTCLRVQIHSGFKPL